jgi:hypothetical protein
MRRPLFDRILERDIKKRDPQKTKNSQEEHVLFYEMGLFTHCCLGTKKKSGNNGPPESDLHGANPFGKREGGKNADKATA